MERRALIKRFVSFSVVGLLVSIVGILATTYLIAEDKIDSTAGRTAQPGQQVEPAVSGSSTNNNLSLPVTLSPKPDISISTTLFGNKNSFPITSLPGLKSQENTVLAKSPAVSTTIFGDNKVRPVFAMPGNQDQKPVPGIPSGSGFKRIDCLIEPDKVVDVASSIAGVIKSINVERGDIVKKGAVLAVLENGVERTNVKLAATRLKFAKGNYTRMEALYKKKVVSLQEKDKTHTELQVATLELRRAKEMLQKRIIVSPLSGIVVQRYISPGEITDQQKVLRIASINPLKIEVVAPIKLLGNMRVGMYARIWPEGPEKGPYVAKVTIVDRVVDAASGTFGVRLALPNTQYKIPAGVKCVAEFFSKKKNTKISTQN